MPQTGYTPTEIAYATVAPPNEVQSMGVFLFENKCLTPQDKLNAGEALLLTFSTWLHRHLRHYLMEGQRLLLLQKVREVVLKHGNAIDSEQSHKVTPLRFGLVDGRYALLGGSFAYDFPEHLELDPEEIPKNPVTAITCDLTVLWLRTRFAIYGHRTESQRAGKAASEVQSAKSRADKQGDVCDNAIDACSGHLRHGSV